MPMPPVSKDDRDDTSRDQADDATTIVVSGLVVDAYVGVHDFEHGVRQRVRFDVDVDTGPGYLDTVRTTGAYVSYADIVEHIQSRAASDEHVELVETWADDVATFVLAHPLAAAVRVRVQKLDIFDAANGVGIVLERHRPHRRAQR
ncbi:MAG: dihydroneopterin aldolase [Actinomycetota bacterium]